MRKTLVVLLGVALAAPVLAVAQDQAAAKIVVGEKVEVKLKNKQPVRGSMGAHNLLRELHQTGHSAFRTARQPPE